MEIYYVYCYLNQTKKGNFNYIDYNFEYEPFYVGKGKNNRDSVHLKDCYNKNVFFKRKINKIIKDTGEIPIIVRVKENMTEEDAFKLEKHLIKSIGRRDLGLGTLVNMTDGGEGLINCSEITKDKLRIPFSQERRTNISKAKKGKSVTKEMKIMLMEYAKVPIIHYNKNLEIIKEYSSIKDACNELKITNASIFRYCKKYFNAKDGSTFRYKIDQLGMKTYIKNEENDNTWKFLQNSRKKG